VFLDFAKNGPFSKPLAFVKQKKAFIARNILKEKAKQLSTKDSQFLKAVQ
jgi:hypothetical protein